MCSKFIANCLRSASALAALLVPIAATAEILNEDQLPLHDAHANHAESHIGVANGQAIRPAYARTLGDYAAPAVSLVNSLGEDIEFSELLAEDRPVLMQFIFTSCATICPLLTATFAHAQKQLTSAHDGYQMISISIDPEYDTPKRLADYAKRNSAGGNWTFLTGAKADVRKVLRAFDVIYAGDNKMYHQPYTFLRPRAGLPWIKVDGFLTARELVQEYRTALQSADVGLN
ncbi:MAG: protein SCO1/2 [Gammaproteobacteria bacterium]|jgi:protein SCO1/2